jgi:hypothetical protein
MRKILAFLMVIIGIILIYINIVVYSNDYSSPKFNLSTRGLTIFFAYKIGQSVFLIVGIIIIALANKILEKNKSQIK